MIRARSSASVGLAYDRSIGTASGLGGPTDNDIVPCYVNFTVLMRGLTPSNRIDIQSLTMPLQITYRFPEYVALVGGYQFIHQRSDRTAVSSIGTPRRQRRRPEPLASIDQEGLRPPSVDWFLFNAGGCIGLLSKRESRAEIPELFGLPQANVMALRASNAAFCKA